MKKMFLAMVLVFALAMPVFAGDYEPIGVVNTVNGGIKNSFNDVDNSIHNTATGGTGGSAVGVAGNVVGIAPGGVVLNNSNRQGQKQQQGQIQGQQQQIKDSGNSTNVIGSGIGNFSPSAKIEKGAIDNRFTNNNGQEIAPVQMTDIKIEAPKQNLLGLPSQSVPELNFGNGRMKDATSDLPNFAIYGIKKLGSEMIKEVLSVNANVKFKNLYKAVLDDAKEVANGGKKTLSDVRYQVIRAEAQKTWTTGGNIGGGGSGVASSGLGGGSGAGSLIPSFGGTKADDLFTIIFVKVAL